MYAAVIREGEIVESPTKRKWVVMGWSEKHTKVELHDPETGDTCDLPPSMLKHVSSEFAGAPLPLLLLDDLAHGLQNSAG